MRCHQVVPSLYYYYSRCITFFTTFPPRSRGQPSARSLSVGLFPFSLFIFLHAHHFLRENANEGVAGKLPKTGNRSSRS